MGKDIEVSLCKFCGCMTKTVRKPGLSASENKHYRYECGKCGAKKELESVRLTKRYKGMSTKDIILETHVGVKK